ncbi:hypothetical protein A3743_16300 [Oleiphilus sp. HI0072]|nr:hypothetical protein A3743_16300 [Oleiphilus sp. HI0072]
MSEQITQILRKKQAAQKIQVSLPTLWRLDQTPDFPRKVKIGARGVGYFEHEIDEWLKSQQEGAA